MKVLPILLLLLMLIALINGNQNAPSESNIKNNLDLNGKALTELFKLEPRNLKKEFVIRERFLNHRGLAALFIIAYESTKENTVVVYAIEDDAARNPARPYDIFKIISVVTRISTSDHHHIGVKEYVEAIINVPSKQIIPYIYENIFPIPEKPGNRIDQK